MTYITKQLLLMLIFVLTLFLSAIFIDSIITDIHNIDTFLSNHWNGSRSSPNIVWSRTTKRTYLLTLHSKYNIIF